MKHTIWICIVRQSRLFKEPLEYHSVPYRKFHRKILFVQRMHPFIMDFSIMDFIMETIMDFSINFTNHEQFWLLLF